VNSIVLPYAFTSTGFPFFSFSALTLLSNGLVSVRRRWVARGGSVDGWRRREGAVRGRSADEGKKREEERNEGRGTPGRIGKEGKKRCGGPPETFLALAEWQRNVAEK
jgi:hypothetical protein